MYKFNGKWMCSEEFRDLAPIAVPREYKDKGGHPSDLKNIHMLVKKDFFLSSFTKGRIEISADDYYKMKINGKFVAQGPSQGYHFAYYRNSVDITPFIKKGDNLIELEVYYHGEITRSFHSGDLRMGFILDMYIDDELYLSSDESFLYAISPCYMKANPFGDGSTQFNEHFDSRLLGSEKFIPCVEKKIVDYTFFDTPSVMVDSYPLSPIEEKPFPGGIFYDFGQEIVATLEIEVIGKEGNLVKIYAGEEKSDDAPFVRYNTRSLCRYEDNWILKEGENHLSQYDYKAFRYAALTFPEDVKIISFKAMVRHFPIRDDAFTYKTNDETLKSVLDLCKATVKYTPQEVYVDCPTREKGQYAGDLTISGPAQVWASRDLRLYKKAIENQMQSAHITKGLLSVTPGSILSEIADYSFQFSYLALSYYSFSEDKEFLKECYETCLGIRDYFKPFACRDGLLGTLPQWNLVDHPQNFRDNYDFPENNYRHNVINAFYVGFMKELDKIRDILGIKTTNEAKDLEEAFNKEFFDYEKGLYKDHAASKHYAFHSNVLPLFYGLCSKGYDEKIAGYIANKGMCCGVYMAFFYLKALCKAGKYDVAYSLITSEGENSWVNMLREGATTTFEAWGKDKKGNCSLCHPWATAPIPILLEDFLELDKDGVPKANHLPDGIKLEVKFKEMIK